MKNYKKIASQIIELTKEVGEYQCSMFRNKKLDISTKLNVSDLVTEVDKKSETMILSFLKTNFPNDGILAEESGLVCESKDGAKGQWVIDPLDGTTNFAHGVPIFSISIAYQVDGISMVGVVYAPYLKETYWAVRGQGAFARYENLGSKGQEDQPLSVRPFKSLSESVLTTGFPYDKSSSSENNLEQFVKIVPQIAGIRRLGSAAYDLALVASGMLHGYWELNLKLWDIAAGTLLVEESGGVWEAYAPNRVHSVVAGSSDIVEVLKEFL